LLIDRDGVDPREYGGKSYDECALSFYHCSNLIFFYRELSKAVESYIKQEDEGKFRCKTCLKLFKATSFVEKHIANKHPELVKHLEEVMSNRLFEFSHKTFSFNRSPISTISRSIRIESNHLLIHRRQLATVKCPLHRRTVCKGMRIVICPQATMAVLVPLTTEVLTHKATHPLTRAMAAIGNRMDINMRHLIHLSRRSLEEMKQQQPDG
jgi:hypothetical protein